MSKQRNTRPQKKRTNQRGVPKISNITAIPKKPKKSVFQILRDWFPLMGVGFFFFANLLDNLNNAVSMITPRVTVGGTILAVISAAIALLLKFKPQPAKNSKSFFNLFRWDLKDWLSLVGIVFLLWTPFWLPFLIGTGKTPEPQIESDTKDRKAELLVSNAFKAGYGLSKMINAGDNLYNIDYSGEDFTMWNNRVEASLEALEINPNILRAKSFDHRITVEEFIYLDDQIRAGIEAHHGKQIAATFTIGSNLFPATNAFEQFLTNKVYRDYLSNKKFSVMTFGLDINSNINEAEMPDELKKDWISIWSFVISGTAYPENVEKIKTFREKILEHFYK